MEKALQNIYRINLEIYQAENCQAHHQGDRIAYPQEKGRLCPWLLDSAETMIRVLMFGGRLPWSYSGTPYAKEIDPDGITTEYVRCPDPTAHVILKITRTKIGFVDADGNPNFLEPDER